MAQAVVLKSNKYGIELMMDPEIPFPELANAVSAKFEESAKFFKDAKVAVSFRGRNLSPEEEYTLVEAICAHSDVHVMCVLDHDQARSDLYKQQLEAYYDMVSGKTAEIYYGSLKAGQTLERSDNVVLVGDVYPDAKIISKGSIVVQGTLKGAAMAGSAGNRMCTVTALEMEPSEIWIGDLVYSGDEAKGRNKKIKHKEKNVVRMKPQMATVRQREIVFKPVLREVFEME